MPQGEQHDQEKRSLVVYNDFDNLVAITHGGCLKTQLKQKVFRIFKPSSAHLHSKFRKNANKNKKVVVFKNSIWVSKTAVFYADFKYVEKAFKNCNKNYFFSKNVTKICTFSNFYSCSSKWIGVEWSRNRNTCFQG
jgi:hypothetical protein